MHHQFLATPLQAIVQHASSVPNEWGRIDSTSIWLRVPMYRASGKPVGITFNLDVRFEGDVLSVQERIVDGATRQLPAACPDRHINSNGTFCLYWQDGDGIRVSDRASAEQWYASLYNFLRGQIYANEHRVWPKGMGRAHGDAAWHEAAAERCAAEFGEQFLESFVARRFRVRRLRLGSGGRFSLRLELQNVRMFAMWDGSDGIANLKAQCPCQTRTGRALAIRKCGRHAYFAAEFIKALVSLEDAETSFVRSLKQEGFQCCDALLECPYKTNKFNDGQESR